MHPDRLDPTYRGHDADPVLLDGPFTLSPEEYVMLGSFCYSQELIDYPPEIDGFMDQLLLEFARMFPLHGFDAYLTRSDFMRCAFSPFYLEFLGDLTDEGIVSVSWDPIISDYVFRLTRYGWGLAKRNNDFDCVRRLHELKKSCPRAS